MESFSITETRRKIGDIVKQAKYQGKSFIITSYGVEMARVIPPDSVSHAPNGDEQSSAPNNLSSVDSPVSSREKTETKFIEFSNPLVEDKPDYSDVIEGETNITLNPLTESIKLQNQSVVAFDGPTEEDLKKEIN